MSAKIDDYGSRLKRSIGRLPVTVARALGVNRPVQRTSNPPYRPSAQRLAQSSTGSGPDGGPQALLLVDSQGRNCGALAAEVAAELAGSYGVATFPYDVPSWNIVEKRDVCELLDAIGRAQLVVLLGFSSTRLERLFQLRAHQILERRAAAEVKSIAVLADSGGDSCPAGIVQRVRSSWPFRELVLLAEGATVAAAAQEQFEIPVSSYSRAAFHSALADGGVRLVSTAAAGQGVAVQIQPLWGGCGSTTAFENEVEELVGLGYFVLRIFVEQYARRGRTLYRTIPRIIAENSVHTAAHVHGLAAATKLPREDRQAAQTALGEFLGTVRSRQDWCIVDSPVADLAAMAGAAIVNHVVNLGFALRVCPRARLLLDVHDYFTRSAFEKADEDRKSPKMSSRSELSRMARSEALLWSIPDFCTTVNDSEQLRISKYALRSEIVLPRPYVPICAPRTSYAWDVLVVADQHYFNVQSVRWLLDLIRNNPGLRKARIAVAGRAGSHIHPREYSDLAGVRFLGFVRDLDALRAASRLTVIPDQAGTGIAIKTLTALAAAHPVVTTTAGVRGLHPDLATDLMAHGSASAFAGDIARLLTDDTELDIRRQKSVTAYAKLAGGWSFTRCLAAISKPDVETVERRRAIINRVLALQSHVAETGTEAGGAVGKMHLDFRHGGNAQDVLRDGWHSGESWGRWMDGEVATLEVGFDSPPTGPLTMVVNGMASPAYGCLAVSINGTELDSRPLRRAMRWSIPELLTSGCRSLRIGLHSSTTYRWADHQETSDQRVVGAGIRAIRIAKQSVLEKLWQRVRAVTNRNDRKAGPLPAPDQGLRALGERE